MKRTTTRGQMTRRAAVGGIGLMALSGCGLLSTGSDEDEREDQDAPEEDTQDESEEDTSDESSEEDTSDTETEEDTESEDETEDDTATSGGSSAEVGIEETFTDEELDDEFRIISAMRDMPSESFSYDVEDGKEVIYLQFEMSPSGQWGGSISPSDFSIENGNTAWSSLSTEISEAGYTAMELHSRRDGDLAPAWIGFVTEGPRQDTYEVTYTRPESEVIGEDTTIPEFTHTVTIPAS